MSTIIEADFQLGARLQNARLAAGLSLLDAMTRVRNVLPEPLWVTNETLRRYEKGVVTETRADPVLLGAMAVAYGVPLSELSPTAAGQVGRIAALIDRLVDLDPDGGSLLRGRDSNPQPSG